MQRPWAVPPDQPDGTLSREALIAALVDAATMLDIAGGCLEVVVGRTPTGVPGEMVMNGAMLCWRDRTDAKPQREQSVQVTPQPKSEPQNLEPEVDFQEELDSDTPAHIDPDDGFDYSTMPEEDVENEPVSTR